MNVFQKQITANKMVILIDYNLPYECSSIRKLKLIENIQILFFYLKLIAIIIVLLIQLKLIV